MHNKYLTIQDIHTINNILQSKKVPVGKSCNTAGCWGLLSNMNNAPVNSGHSWSWKSSAAYQEWVCPFIEFFWCETVHLAITAASFLFVYDLSSTTYPPLLLPFLHCLGILFTVTLFVWSPFSWWTTFIVISVLIFKHKLCPLSCVAEWHYWN